jgi:2-polyprenyl-3-methyl-5-hydroxy-6-metoxy-1,4-benzoquinol methylase
LQRRNRPELMDQPQIDERELATDLRNLAWINRLLGGIAVVRAHLPKRGELVPVRWSVLDVATGGGDIPRWIASRGLPVDLTAADLHPQMLRLARKWSAGLPIRRFEIGAWTWCSAR